jgi:hypothetical protein
MSHSTYSTLLYLEPNQLNWYDTASSQIQTIPLSKEVVGDMEVINPDQLGALLQPLLSQGPNMVAIMVDPRLMFQKVITNSEQTETDVESFLDLVPFERIAHTLVQSATETMVLATNYSFLKYIKRIIEKNGSTVGVMLPLSLLNTTNLQLAPLNSQSAATMLEQAGGLEQYGLSADSEEPKPEPQAPAFPPTMGPTSDTKSTKQPKKSNSLKLLVPVFALLVIVLVGMLIWQRQPPTKPTSTLAQAQTPTTNTAQNTSANQAAMPDLTTVSVQILASQNALAKAEEVAKTFQQAGFNMSPTNQQTAISTSQTIVFIDAKYPPALRERVERLLKTHEPEYNIQEAESPAVGVTIILGSVE